MRFALRGFGSVSPIEDNVTCADGSYRPKSQCPSSEGIAPYMETHLSADTPEYTGGGVGTGAGAADSAQWNQLYSDLVKSGVSLATAAIIASKSTGQVPASTPVVPATTTTSTQTQIINQQNEIAKIEAALKSTPAGSAQYVQLNAVLNGMKASLAALLGYVPTQIQSQAGSPKTATSPLVPTLGVAAVGALAGYFARRKPAHAAVGAGVGGVLGYLLSMFWK
jgi:hypothetical protein